MTRAEIQERARLRKLIRLIFKRERITYELLLNLFDQRKIQREIGGAAQLIIDELEKG